MNLQSIISAAREAKADLRGIDLRYPHDTQNRINLTLDLLAVIETAAQGLTDTQDMPVVLVDVDPDLQSGDA